ncbi:unnamed protein product [Caenorhabditis angaria]|uniref:Uncharacterized protein n=1 Tax=Caenorhabditis angaria TaxID=860376 RepID=A0A9P1J2N9_9PELO|nr:unnamed protein product [Caenorhabditis angaria]
MDSQYVYDCPPPIYPIIFDEKPDIEHEKKKEEKLGDLQQFSQIVMPKNYQTSPGRKPIFIVIVICLQMFLFYSDRLENTNLARFYKNLPNFWQFLLSPLVNQKSQELFFLLNIAVLIAIGIPLEIVHGSFRMILIYTLSTVYCGESRLFVNGAFLCEGAGDFARVLIFIHISNVFINWDSFSSKFGRVIFAIYYSVASQLHSFYQNATLGISPTSIQIVSKNLINIETQFVVSIWLGIFFGLCWLYGKNIALWKKVAFGLTAILHPLVIVANKHKGVPIF